jgi:hypothetical protein
MRRSFLVGLVPVLAFAAATFTSTKQAHAGPHLDLDLDLGTALQSRSAATGAKQTAVDFSLGGGARLGYRFGIPGSIVYLQPEISGKYMRFGFNSGAVGYDYAGVLNGGLKLGLSGIVQPSIFGHVGLGIMGYNVDATRSEGVLGPEADVGAGIDFRIVPGFTLGAQIAYNTVIVPAGIDTGTGNQEIASAKWVSFGLTAGFHIGEPRPRPVYVQPVYYRPY